MITAFILGRGNVEAALQDLYARPRLSDEEKRERELIQTAQKGLVAELDRMLAELAMLEGSLERRRVQTHRTLQLLTGGLVGTAIAAVARRLVTGSW